MIEGMGKCVRYDLFGELYALVIYVMLCAVARNG